MEDRPISTNRGTTRRSLLAATGIGTATALAGCLGGDEGDVEAGTVRMRTSQSTTTAYSANEGIAKVISDNNDDLTVEARTSEGTEANLGALNSQEAEMVYIQNWSAQDVQEGAGDFDQLEFEMAQVFHFYDLPWFFLSPGLESLSGIESGTTVSPTPRGSGTAPALERALDYATDDYNRTSVGYGDQSGSLNEGSLDVGVGTYMNFSIVPGWVQEMLNSADLNILDVDDSTLEEWENDDRLLIQSFSGDEIDGTQNAPEEVHCPTFAYNFVSRADLDYDTVYDFLETMHENRSALEEYSAVLARLDDEAFWVENMYSDVPFHAAAADFYEEIGVWQDEFERADEP
ncbi:TAXI family TRAP transporter solute-binding subunit [Natrialba sp. PRR66]|uniref:TAXI family TRAP transporter solute-binding subunit n=1 Tax=Natrialba sp. PRR66 TaxID=3098146 RepID=UPI002B1E8C9B|nr:TAXI family TRAP transporter solute-binding subunit [Natrialba sp. PRR66]